MKLENINKKEIFKVPDHYFEELPERIHNKIHKSGKITISAIKWRYAVASLTFIILFGIIYIVFNLKKEPTYQDYLSELTDDQMIEYIYLNDISVYQIDEALKTSEELYEEMLNDQMDFDAESIEQELYFEDIEILTDEIENKLNK